MNNQDIPSTTSEDLKKKLEIKSEDLIAYPQQNLASILLNVDIIYTVVY